MVSLVRARGEILRNRVCVFGPPKAGKTELMGKLSEQYNLYWLDGEVGYSPLFKLPEEWQNRIKLFRIQDRDGKATFINALLKIATGAKGTICDTHGIWNCVACKNNPAATFEEICLREFTDKDMLVLDSGSALAESALAQTRLGMEITAKNEFDNWGGQGTLVSNVLRSLQNINVNFCMSTHEVEVELEDGTITVVPNSGTRNASRNTGKYFDHVVYMRVAGNKHKAGSATTYLAKVLTGSRTDVTIEEMKESTLLPFFDMDHPINKERKEKAAQQTEKAKVTAGNTMSALNKLRAGQAK